MIASRPGNVVVLAGHNRHKIGKIKASLEAGLNVLADKPWIIRAEDLTELEASLTLAEQKGLVAYDMMTERHEITTILQRELVNDPAVFGTLIPADPEQSGRCHGELHHHSQDGCRRSQPASAVLLRHLRIRAKASPTWALTWWIWCSGRSFRIKPSIIARIFRCRAASAGRPRITAAQFTQITGAAAFSRRACPYVHGDQIRLFLQQSG